NRATRESGVPVGHTRNREKPRTIGSHGSGVSLVANSAVRDGAPRHTGDVSRPGGRTGRGKRDTNLTGVDVLNQRTRRNSVGGGGQLRRHNIPRTNLVLRVLLVHVVSHYPNAFPKSATDFISVAVIRPAGTWPFSRRRFRASSFMALYDSISGAMSLPALASARRLATWEGRRLSRAASIDRKSTR